jgi:sigma-B regulation protein RsbU (phosphoserine phosphatase)
MGMFATIFFGVLNPATGSLAYINAGHLAPIIVGNGGVKHILGSTGPFVGLMPNMKFEIRDARIDPGDFFIGYTDGVTEAISESGELFTQKRLEGIITGIQESAADMITNIRSKLTEFTANVPQSDDITILAVRRDQRPIKKDTPMDR